LFNFLKSWIGLIIIIFTFFALISTGKIIIFPADNLEAAQKQSETNEVDNMNNPTDNNEGYDKAYFTETNNLDYSNEVTVKSISEGDDSMDNLVEELEEDEDTFKEEAGEEQEAAVVEEIKDENNNPGQNEDQDIDFSNSDDFRIEVDLTKQKVFVYYKDNLIKEMIRFYKKYLFHSVPFDKNGGMIIEEYEKLGSPVSHGCIRLKLEEAKWLYDKLPSGVKVIIYK